MTRKEGTAERPVRILVAEDDPLIQQLIQTIFRQRSWETIFTDNGRDAVENWRQGDFDLILMDVSMPQMDGLEATRLIRREEERSGSRTPIVALTAHAIREEQDRCLEAGMDDLLTKPFQFPELFAVLETYL